MMNWIISFTLCSGLMLMVYCLLLSRAPLFRFNRFYLVGSLLFAMLVCFINIPIRSSKETIIKKQTITTRKLQATYLQAQGRVKGNGVHTFDWSSTFIFAYSLVTAIFLTRFFLNVYRIRNKVTNSIKKGTVILVDEDISPYSFFTYIFLNRASYECGDIRPEVICHERAHGRQLHSIDILLVEILQALFWFNVFIPFFRRAIQLNHEYLADAAVVDQYHNSVDYQYLILAMTHHEKKKDYISLSSQFNFQIIKRRLVMLNKKTQPLTGLLRQFAIVPTIAIAIILFAKRVDAKSHASIITTISKKYKNTSLLSVKVDDETAIFKGKSSDDRSKDNTVKNNKTFTSAEKSTDITVTHYHSEDTVQHPPAIGHLLKMIQDSAKNHDNTIYKVWIDGKLINHNPLFGSHPAVDIYFTIK